MTQKFPINILTAPSATADGTKLAVDFYGDTVRLDTDTFTPAPPPPVVAYGTSAGYWAGGLSTSFALTDVIGKITWSSDTVMSDVGQFNPGPALPGVNPANPGAQGMGVSNSSSNAYYIGGDYYTPSQNGRLTGTRSFPFSSAIGSINTASISGGDSTAVASGRSPDYGYYAGGYNPSPFAVLNTVIRFAFASESYAPGVGVISSGPRYYNGGISSSEAFYALGGGTSPFSVTNSMDKWPFANDSSSAHPGSFGTSAQQFGTVSGPDAGFAAHGRYYPGSSDPSGFGWWNNLERLPFASDTTTVDVGQLVTAGYGSAGNGSDSNGYLTGTPADNTQLNRFPFASSYPATDYATNPHGMLGHNSPTGATSN